MVDVTPVLYNPQFDGYAFWADVMGSGGGASGRYLTQNALGGGGAGCAIKTHDIVSATASITVGTGGVSTGNNANNPGTDSTYNDGTTVLTGGGAPSFQGGTASGGDLNIEGGSGSDGSSFNDAGGDSFLGASKYSQDAVYGAGGCGSGYGGQETGSGGDGVVYIKEFLVVKPAPTYSTSRAPKTTVYDTAGGPYTHNFDPAARWAKVIVTGGGGGGSTDSWTQVGESGGTAIKQFDIGTATASITVGAGGAVGGNQGGNSVYDDGTNTLTANGGYRSANDLPSGGDINLKGGGRLYSSADVYASGSPSYWGGGASEATNTRLGAYGSGGGSRTGSSAATAGVVGVVVIEEHF